MKALYVVIFLFLIVGCKSNTKAYSEITQDGYLKETKVHTKLGVNKCLRIEYNVIKDTSTNHVLSKEVIRYNCRGAWAEIVFCKKWKLENNKMVLQKINCKPQKF